MGVKKAKTTGECQIVGLSREGCREVQRSAQSSGFPHKRLKACHKLFHSPAHSHNRHSSVCVAESVCVICVCVVCERINVWMNEWNAQITHVIQLLAENMIMLRGKKASKIPSTLNKILKCLNVGFVCLLGGVNLENGDWLNFNTLLTYTAYYIWYIDIKCKISQKSKAKPNIRVD